MSSLVTQVYRKHLETLKGGGFFFAIADDAKIRALLIVINEMVDGFPYLTWHESGLKTRYANNKLYV
jgi:hypothetical protein